MVPERGRPEQWGVAEERCGSLAAACYGLPLRYGSATARWEKPPLLVCPVPAGEGVATSRHFRRRRCRRAAGGLM